jgi:peptidoglycan L-alanyl-D-glutamate endopeptidase CwlK
MVGVVSMGRLLHPEKADGLDARLLKFLQTAADELEFDVLVVRGKESDVEAKRLYAQGRTTPGKIVTHAPDASQSAHGHAGGVDAVPQVNGKAFPVQDDPDYPQWATNLQALIAFARACGLVCGADWPPDRVDPDHFQVPDWRDLPVVP